MRYINESIEKIKTESLVIFPNFRANREYIYIYNNLVQKLGILKPTLAYDIAVFYSYCIFMIEELNYMIDIEKLSGYCLNSEHQDGQHKAKVFRSALNWGADEYEILKTALLKAVREI